ncbi:single-stranded-DNA-specific exonuclease RecJ [Kaarinaea lacus]
MSLKIKRQSLPHGNELLLPDLHPILNRIYRNRGIKTADELKQSLDCLLSFTLLKGIDDAVQLLEQALRQQQSILIIGDFDADGATSTSVAIRALKKLGASNVNYLVPNRFEYGYGLTPEIVACAEQYHPDLIVTVDNGISSIQGVKAAKQLGIKVIVTDHHLAGRELPEADAIVNPNQPGDAFPSKAIAGVGVIFYVMLALRAQLRESQWFVQQGISEPNLAELLDLVALGTVADVVPLDHNNRILVAQGLARVRAGHCCAGIKALVKIAGRQLSRMSAQDFAFAVGPRLNAAGRLDDMSLGIECLLSDNDEVALALAEQLNQLNQERRSIEEEMKLQAMDTLEQMDEAELPTGICVYEPEWHQGVIGILASRIKEKFHRPVIAFADAGDDVTTSEAIIKGSARSIPGVHIRDVLDAIATRHPDLLTKFGGHAMAAGLTLRKESFAEFATAFNEEVCRHVDSDALHHIIHSDGELSTDDLDLPLAQLLESAGPWGQHFAEPQFDGSFEIVQKRIVGERHLKLLLKVPGSSRIIDGIAFNSADDLWPADTQFVQIAYKLATNEYRGVLSPQLIIDFIEPFPVEDPVTT